MINGQDLFYADARAFIVVMIGIYAVPVFSDKCILFFVFAHLAFGIIANFFFVTVK